MARTSAPGSNEDSQAEVIAYLGSGHAFGGAKPIQIETHAARVFLAGDRAWKIKRAVRYPYLDFSTLEQRHRVLRSELELNRRTAPDMYLGLWPITRDAERDLHVAGPGEIVEWILEMQRFPDAALLSVIADHGGLDEMLLTRLATRIADFHRTALIVETDDGAARMRRVIEGNIRSAGRYRDLLAEDRVAELSNNQCVKLASLSSLLDMRARAGRIRHCHADLHLANIAMIDSEPTLFDCLEFDSELASIDVLYDLAFLLMDLWQRDAHREAGIVFNRYLDLSAEDELGVALLPLFMSVRASIRAHVSAASALSGREVMMCAARSYLNLALGLLAPERPRLIAIGGLSGTGKSTLARHVAGEVGVAPGARVIRTDVIRKRLAGIAIEERLPKESYTPEASRHVYATSLHLAAHALASGQSVILDAVFAEPDDRQAVAALADRLGLTFIGLWLEAPDARRLDRIAKRSPDASDADVPVARAQKAIPIARDELHRWTCVGSEQEISDLASQVKALISGSAGSAGKAGL